MKVRRALLIATACCAVIAGLTLWHLRIGGGERASGGLGSSVYVWQRVWAEPVSTAVRTTPDNLRGLAPLGAEVTWRRDGSAEVAWPNVDFVALRLEGRATSAVLRIGPRAPAPAAVPVVCSTARELLERFRVGGVTPDELQVDFDCAESQLEGYRWWLAAVREAVAPVPVRPTVLPSWLDQRAFAELARDCGGYVLQVHATERPRLDAPETALCETDRARKWVERAGRIGVPFRVALPTYTYVVGFTPDGKLLGIQAEGEGRVWPHGTVIRVFRPDPAHVARLVGDWQRDRPACLVGLLWYRLPVATDTLNWRWPTLAAVMAGRVPRGEVRVEKSGDSPMDLMLVNTGEAEAPLPAEVAVGRGGSGVEADGVGGYRVELRGSEVVFHRAPELASTRLPPGARHPLGWLRVNAPIEIYVR